MAFPTNIVDLADKVDGVNYPQAADINSLNAVVEALETKVGVDDSAVSTTLDYKLKNTSGGHDHDGVDSKSILAASLPTGIDAAKIADGSISNTEFQYLNGVGSTVVGKDDTVTMTLKTLTTPVVASFYQDAGKTKLMTTPNTASDTLVAVAATQTLTNKTLTTPIIASISNSGTITVPTGTDTLVGRATTDTLTNKTLTSPVLNTGISGTAFLDEDNMASNSATKVASQQSIKAYVDAQILACKNALFPVGSYYSNGAVSTNPATLLGFGTWTAVAGKVIVGLDGTQTEFDTLGETGGEKTHALTEAELATHTHIQNAHSHTVPAAVTSSSSAGSSVFRSAASAVSTDSATATNQNAGSGTAHNNLQPYEVAALWRRTA